MAVLSGFPGLISDVRVQNVVCKEYPTPSESNNDTPTSVTKYIEAQEGAEFTVRLRIDTRFKHSDSDIVFGVDIDGRTMRELVLRKAKNKVIKQSIGGAVVGSDGVFKERKFYFSTLVTTDDPVKPVDKSLLDQMNSLGEITVKVIRVVALERVPCKQLVLSDDLEHISEKNLKGRAISRKTKLGAALPTEAPNQQNVTWIDSRENPLASFTFRYRSLADLKAEFIVPRSPSPVSLEDRPLEELSAEEMRELLRQQKRQKEEMVRVKQECKRERSLGSEVDVDDDEVTILPAKPKRRRIETIDLTED